MYDASNNLRQRQSTQDPWNRQRQQGFGRSRSGAGSGSGHPPRRQRPGNSNQRNTSSSSLKQQILLLLASLVGLGAWYLTPLSDYVIEFLLTQVPIEADLELGKQAIRQTGNQQQFPPTIHDAKWTPKLNSIGWDLIDSSEFALTKEYQWDFGIVKDDQMVNAFALPGGVIRVTSGLLRQLQLTDGELAALIGHEMGHVIHRHSQARILQQQLLNYILKALVYEDDDPHQESFGEAIGELMVKSADWLGQQSFSRSNEYQADAASWDLLVSSRKYNPQALQSLLDKLWTYHGKQGGKTSWESTHPGTLDRIGALDDKWQSLTHREQQKLTRNTFL